MSSTDHDQTASLLPFHGLRFRDDLPGEISATLGPPADIESSDEARAFVAGREHNAIRLEIEDAGEELRFAAARALLDQWQTEGVLRRDTQPSYYIYQQEFDDLGVRRARCGVFGLVPLDATDVCVLPHEETWEENRQRRLQLLRDLDAAISPIFLIFDTDQQAHGDAVRAATDREPNVSAIDDAGNHHRMWVVSEAAQVDALREVMQGRHFVVADGHHRYAAARQFHEERGRPETALVLACCVPAHDPGIVIRPIHRMIAGRDPLDLISAMGELDQWFEVSTDPVGDRTGHELEAALGGGDLPVAGVVTNDGVTFVTLRLRSWDHVDELLPDPSSGPSRELDVTVISELVIRRALKIEADAEQRQLSFTSDPSDVLAAVRSGTAGLGVLLRPITLRQVLSVARAHDRVPAKSTAFVPKVPVGLVMQVFGDE